jgi:hypothetical protein
MERFPLRFCQPTYFGAPPSPEHPVQINNGTVSLISLRRDYFAITCCHVLKAYRKRLAEDPRTLFAIGNCYLDPLSSLVAEEPALDVAVLRLTHAQAESVKRSSIDGIGEAFFEMNAWPPIPVQVDDYVAFGGFPGDLRRLTSFRDLDFGTYSSGAARVTDVHADYCACKFEREYWITHFHEAEPESLGGLSGGPVFALRFSPAGIMTYELAGIIFRMHEPSETLYIRQAGAFPIPEGS